MGKFRDSHGGMNRKELKIAEQQLDAEGNATRLSTFTASKNPDKAQRQLIELEQRDFETRFQPLEERLRAEITDSGEGEAKRAGETAAKAGVLSREQFMRDLGRSGTQLTTRQSGAIKRSQGLSAARDVTTAKNVTRQTTRDTNLEAQAALIGIGRDVAATGRADLATAANLQSGRESANRQAESAEKAQTTSMVATGLGLAAAFLI